MIDTHVFERLDEKELLFKTKGWMDASCCDRAFAEYFVENHRRMDRFRVRCAIALLATYDSKPVRTIVLEYLRVTEARGITNQTGENISVNGSARFYFYSQQRSGFIAELPESLS